MGYLLLLLDIAAFVDALIFRIVLVNFQMYFFIINFDSRDLHVAAAASETGFDFQRGL